MSARQSMIVHIAMALAVIAAALVLAVYHLIDSAAAVALIAAVAGPVLGSTITLSGVTAGAKPAAELAAKTPAPSHVTVLAPTAATEPKES